MNTYISNRLKKALRLGAISFLLPLFSSLITSCEDVPMPFNNPELPPEPEIVVIDPVGNGTKDNPYNVAGVLAYLNTLGADVESTKDIWVKGVVTSVTEPFNTQYGNASFNISDTEDAPNKFTFYRGYYFGNKKYNNENDLNVAINDVVLICGKVINYRGNTPETSQNKAYVVSINGKGADIQPEAGGDPKGTGTQADPFNIAAAVAKCKEVGETASTDKYYIKGIADGDYTVGSYKNIDVDLVDKAGSSEKFKVYHCKGLDGKDITEGFKVSKGDEIVVYGPVVNFMSNTPETATGAYVVSVNGKAPDGTGGGGDTPGKAVGSIDNPKTCSEALTVINGLADGGKTDVDYYVKGKITKIKTSDENIAKYKNIDYIITDGTTEITVYRGKNLNNTDFTEAGQINVGDEVVVLGKLFKYVKDGNMTPEIDQGNYIVKLTKASGN